MCNCVETINEKLKKGGYNTQISMGLVLTENMSKGAGVIFVATEKLDKSNRKKPTTIQATYCPFCGKKWGSDDEADQP